MRLENEKLSTPQPSVKGVVDTQIWKRVIPGLLYDFSSMDIAFPVGILQERKQFNIHT